jgi:dihydroxyacid dehydratase/phosphogluconate dehydratase
VRDGDEIELDVPARRLEVLLSEAEIKNRLKQRPSFQPHYLRGYGKLFLDHVLQAHEGCDFDFLRGRDCESSETPVRMFPSPGL